mmetsp:Transcript_22037/g.67658  ORF Transcript_22037/g.67658 Transcript_22037/m.67658 type:complete len:341 (-) Transcript_22037:914-1936(-)
MRERGRRARQPQGQRAAVAQPAAAGRARGPHHLRHERAGARPELRRLPALRGVPRHAGVRDVQGAAAARHRGLGQRAAGRRRAGRRPGRRRPVRPRAGHRQVPRERRGVQLHARVDSVGPRARPVARAVGQAPRALHGRRAVRGRGPHGDVGAAARRAHHGVHLRAGHVGARRHRVAGQEREHPVPRGPHEEPGEVPQGGDGVLHGARRPLRGGEPRHRPLRVLAGPGGHAGDGRLLQEDGRLRRALRLLRPVRVQGELPPRVPAPRRGRAGRGRAHADGLRGPDPDLHVARDQDQRRHRSVLVAQAAGPERGRGGGRRGRHVGLVHGRPRPEHDHRVLL